MNAAARLPADPQLPGLGYAWNAGHMCGLFQRELAGWTGEDADIVRCTVKRFRYRPATRSVVLYELELRDRASSTTHRQWVSGSIYPGDRPGRLYRKLRKRWRHDPEAGACDGHGAVGFAEELNMLVQLYPADRHLPTLPAFTRTPPPALVEALQADAGGGATLACCSVTPVRYRPGIGATLRYDTVFAGSQAGTARAARYFVKVYAGDEGRRAYHTARRLHDQLASCRGAPGVARPVAWLPELSAMVLESAPGVSFEEALCHRDEIAPVLHRTAAALAALHGEPGLAPSRAVHAPPAAHLSGTADFVRWACPDLAEPLDRIASRLHALEPAAPAALVHGDLKTEHIFIDRARNCLVDVDGCAAGDPARDVASLIARIRTLAALGALTPQRADAACETLLSQYPRHAGRELSGHFGAWYAVAMLQNAVHLIQRQARDWPRHARRFVDEAARAAGSRDPAAPCAERITS